MDLLAAVDLLDGRAVRLVRGSFGSQRRYGDPVALAEHALDGGADWLHVVDLDAARTGTPRNARSVGRLVEAARRRGADVEIGGGVRSVEAAAAWLESGVRRVVLGTAALEDPSLAARCARMYPGRIAVGFDYRREPQGALVPAIKGWLDDASTTLELLAEALRGVPLGAIVATAIERDGTLDGPDVDGLARVLEEFDVPVIASGGVGRIEDLHSLRRMGSSSRRIAGVVVGRALLDGTIDVREAVDACRASD